MTENITTYTYLRTAGEKCKLYKLNTYDNYEFDIIRTNKEIAEILGFSQQKVRTNIQKARDLLSTKFE